MRPRTLSYCFALLTTAGVVLSACGGGGGGGGSTLAPSASPTATPVTSQSQNVSLSTSGSQAASYAVTGYSSIATIPAGNVATTLSTTFETTQPAGTPTIQSMARRPQNIGASAIGAIAFLCVAPAATVTLTAYPSFTLTLPSSINGAFAYVAFYDPTNPSAGWTTIEGPASGSGLTLGFTGSAPGPTLHANDTYCFLFFTLASALPSPTPTVTASPTAAPTVASAFTCPANDSSANVVARSVTSSGSDAVRRSNGLGTPRSTENTATGLLAVTYSTSTATGSRASTLATAEQSAGGTMVRQYSFARSGKVVHVLSVPATQMSTIAARLRAQSGVESVAPTGLRRYATAAAADWTNDPYFDGFTMTQNTQAGSGAPSTFEVAPYAEAGNVPGQWDMHAIELERAFGYSLAGNGTGSAHAGALGSSTVKIAIIDTGEDPNHPELASKIAYQKCYITNEDGTVQSSSNFETDPLGHGTDVSGIAAADTNNSFGFTGTGGNVVIYGYRVFPTPDDNCAADDSPDARCGADTQDIASAIDDAVQQHVNVISMSLGGGVCGTGSGFAANGDSDPVEGAAVQEAINAGVIVVAASGNSGGSGVSSPACDSSVIAVGATSLSDGTPDMTGNVSGTAIAPVEYVTSYTQFGTTNTVRSPSSWGIVAPGGDPSSDDDNDDLHWIENIWTTTPYQASGSDENFVGNCARDYPATTGPIDCRVLIAGTSMATPHVAGAAALILSATGGLSSPYQSASAMKALLCTTADDLPGSASTQGCGRLNVYTAMATALSDPSPPTPVP